MHPRPYQIASSSDHNGHPTAFLVPFVESVPCHIPRSNVRNSRNGTHSVINTREVYHPCEGSARQISRKCQGKVETSGSEQSRKVRFSVWALEARAMVTRLRRG